MATKTIGLTGRDYSTLAAYASYLNALTLSAPEVAEFYKDSGAVADTAQVIIGGYTGNSGTNTITFRPATGEGFKDDAGAATNPLKYDASKGAALSSTLSFNSGGTWRFTGGNVIVDGLQFSNQSSSAGFSIEGGASGMVVRNCIIDIAPNAYVSLQIAASAATVQNTVVVMRGSGSKGVETQGSSVSMEGCLLVKVGTAAGTGFRQAYGGSPVLKNTACIGFTTDFSGTYSASSTNNATDKGTFGGTNVGGSGQVSITSADFESLTSGSEDFRIKSTSAKLKDTGATAGLSTDIIGQTRGASYDIGPWEIVAAVPKAGVTRRGGASFNNLFSM